MPGTEPLDPQRGASRGDSPRRETRSARRRIRPFLESGFSLLETVIVAAVLLSSLLLLFRMMGNFSLWWSRQEQEKERAASVRHALYKMTDLLFMAGYRPSERGIHAMEPERMVLEYLVEGADESPGVYSRHRRFTIFREDDRLKLTTQRRLLPLSEPSRWGAGSTTVLAEGVRELGFAYLDSRGEPTEEPREVRLVVFSLSVAAEGSGPGPPPKDRRYRSAVFLRNNLG